MADEYCYNPAGRPILDAWLRPDPGDPTSVLKHQARLLIESLETESTALKKSVEENDDSANEWLARAVAFGQTIKKLKAENAVLKAELVQALVEAQRQARSPSRN